MLRRLCSANTLAILVVLLAALGPATDLIPAIRGSLPLNHALVPYGFEEKDIPDLTNKNFLVTGANASKMTLRELFILFLKEGKLTITLEKTNVQSGVGYGTSKVLASHGATVYMACRSVEKCEDARRKIIESAKGTVKESQLICERLNLSSLKDVKRYGETVRNSGRTVDSLILNAGIMFPPFELTEDGLESTWGVNHVAHFLLTHELLPVLEKSPKATIVSVASNAQYQADKQDDISLFNDKASYNPFIQYGRSKLANVLFAKELAKRVGPKILVNSLNPGGVQGELIRHLPSGIRQVAGILQQVVYWSEEQSALTVIGCAWNPKLFQEHITGRYFVPVWREDGASGKARNSTLAKLWFDETEKLLRLKNFL